MMSEYKKPIRINANDPLCSATSLEGTVIGILFEKTGAEIKAAIGARCKSIDSKIQTYKGSIDQAEKFIEEKEKTLKSLDEFIQEQNDSKEAMLAPLRKKIAEINRKAKDQCSDVYKEIIKIEDHADEKTEQGVAKRAVTFEESFETVIDQFKGIEEILKKDRDSGTSFPSSGFLRMQGVSASSGSQTISGSTPTSSVYLANSAGGYQIQTDGSVGLGTDDPSEQLDIVQKEDAAVARMNTLRARLTQYRHQVEAIMQVIHELEEERRRLMLIWRNVDPGRPYKLDINKLSAFGFEDIEHAE